MLSTSQRIRISVVTFVIFSAVENAVIVGWDAEPSAIYEQAGGLFERNNSLAAYASTSNSTSDSISTSLLDASAIIIAIISLISAALVAILTYIFNIKQNNQLAKQNDHLAVLKNKLETQKDEEAAKTEYRYEARKNLYGQFEPLLFQLHELSNRAYERIIRLGEDFRRGNLRAGDGWLSDCDGFYFTMTLYLLLAPVGIFYLMSRRLTQFDLQLDLFYDNQYLLSKLIYRTFSHDFKLASYEPKINDYGVDNISTPDPSNWHKQGIDSEILDQVGQALIIKDPLENIVRIMTFGEFHSRWKKKSDGGFDFKQQLEYLLKNFHPENKCVLWRILIAQAHIYQLLIDNYLSNDSTDISEKIALVNLEAKQMKSFDWRNDEDKKRISDDEVMKPFAAVKEYLKNDVAVDYKKYRGRPKVINTSNKALE